jgi:hypothetical protein
LVSALVVRMNLDAELLTGKEEFDQQGKTVGLGRCLSDESRAMLHGQRANGLSGEGAAGDPAFFARKPDFADGIAFDNAGEIGS